MKITQASPDDFGRIRSFYHSLIDDMKEQHLTITWIKDVYPAPEFLRSALNNGELYLCCDGPRIAASMVVNRDCNEGYRNLGNETPLTNAEVLVIHALGVHPDYSGKGIGKMMVEEAIEIAKKSGAKGLRLDVLKGNEAARKLYLRCGFEYVGSVQMYYENTGNAYFGIYEFVI